MLGTKPRSSGRKANALSCWATSPAPATIFLISVCLTPACLSSSRRQVPFVLIEKTGNGKPWLVWSQVGGVFVTSCSLTFNLHYLATVSRKPFDYVSKAGDEDQNANSLSNIWRPFIRKKPVRHCGSRQEGGLGPCEGPGAKGNSHSTAATCG